jgi:hypothetical protein
MIKFTTLFDLEMTCLDGMNRQQLVEAIQRRSDGLPADLLEQMEARETDQLRLLLFAGRLIHALRRMQTVRPTCTAALK